MSSFVLFLQLFCRSAEEPFPGFSEVGSQRSLLFLYLLARLFLHTFIYSLHTLKVFFFCIDRKYRDKPCFVTQTCWFGFLSPLFSADSEGKGAKN